jgi:hypothetical protein
MNMTYIYTQGWYKNLNRAIRAYIDQTIVLLERERASMDTFEHYGFLVFPAAKAYEGYLKNYLYTMGLVTEHQVYSEHFRIGKALNPDLPKSYRKDDWVFERLSTTCGEKTAGLLWEAWREGRNKVFHFNDGHESLSLVEAEMKIDMIFAAIAEADRCGVKLKDDE